MPTLTVSIPTYKRPALLRRNLQALAPQCLKHGVTVHLFDDSCSNVNQAVYDEIAAKWPCLEVHRNARNLGIDRNIDQCVSAPTADYVWIIGEDDLAAEGAISTILERIGQYPNFLFLNYQYISNDYCTLLNVAVSDAPDGSICAGEFFGNHGWAMGFLGANVIRKSHWDASNEKFIGTYFSHVGKIFSALDPASSIGAIGKPMVFNRAESLDSFTWVDDSFEVNAGFERMIYILSVDQPQWRADAARCLEKFMSIMNLRNLKSILVLRALGVYDWKKYNLYMRDLPGWILYAAVSVTPVSLMSRLYRIYRSIKRGR